MNLHHHIKGQLLPDDVTDIADGSEDEADVNQVVDGMASDSDEDDEDFKLTEGDMEDDQPKQEKQSKQYYVIYVVINKERNGRAAIEQSDITKVGMTRNLSDRIQFYLDGNSRYLEKNDVLPVIFLDKFSPALNQKLLSILKLFLDDVIADELVPAGLREFYTNVRDRDWHR